MKTTEAPGTRDRLIGAMFDSLQRKGLHGVGLSEILHDAQAPKGVMYHHFPGGKADLAVAAIEAGAAQIKASLLQVIEAHADPADALKIWWGHAHKRLERSGFERGCPLAAISLESTPDDIALRDALAQAFGAFRELVADLLAGAGIGAKRSTQLAALIVSAYEGSLIQARVAGSAKPVNDTVEMLLGLLRIELANAKESRA
ncbi:TetR/AcrR family transcriptional regulator [Dyella marensis]|uniref:Transcriptional regulator, TetR family n=1 Tax=Dyella marensis TaxID=500610 RepID=A0A1I2BN00_9GAMM|nr:MULTISPECIES: TetR/AcrR family transcriptional regulator [Dyella]SFE57555.1 transcriptional regulator, TetR family [Dyella marensis]